MTINSEQIKALAARLQMKANEAKQSDDWGCDSNNFHDVATPDNILSLLADRDADKALIAEQAERIAELECVCAESYQVVGVLADSLGVFNDTKTIKALDNLSAQMLVHTDVLPFSVESSTLTVKLPTAYDLSGETDGNCSLNDASMNPDANGCYFRRRDVEQACAAAGITLDVGE